MSYNISDFIHIMCCYRATQIQLFKHEEEWGSQQG